MKIEIGTKAMLTEALRHRTMKEKKRNYLGVSLLGEECSRKIWYRYHKPELATPIEPRIQAIFNFGNMIEDYIVELLAETGMELFDKDENGKQFEAVYGKIKGHIDGVIKGLPESSKNHLLEVKSMNDSNFSKLEKNQLEIGFPTYYAQCLVYMELFNLERCLFVAMNKNNCEIYVERIESDSIRASYFLKRGLEIADAEIAPEREYKSSTFYKCRFCEFNKSCWA